MEPALKKLMKLMPPPEGSSSTDINWTKAEELTGLNYPKSFRDFASVYGASTWFDNLTPMFPTDFADKAEKSSDFLQLVRGRLHYLRRNMYDASFNRVKLPLYPDKGGLFPFLAEIDGNLHCWKTDGSDPDQWPVYCWLTGEIVVLEYMTIAKMILSFMERKVPMFEIWGDYNQLSPERKVIRYH